MTDIATQILSLARLAEAPTRDFRPWQEATVVQIPWQQGVAVAVLSYKVPKGFGLVVTRVDTWVSGAYNLASTPGTPKEVEEIITWPNGWDAAWRNDGEIVAGRFSNYLALGKGEQLIVFPPDATAEFLMTYSGINEVTPEQSFAFRFFGFLTLAEHAERLTKNQSLTP